MATSSPDRNPVDRLAEEFAERFRNGERPSLTEYVERYPEYGAEIRELFPALVALERFKPAAGDATGAFAAPGTPAVSPPPEQLGDYRILREVGRGGMGVVYEAEQVSLGRHVALKVLPPHALLNPTYLERFRREAKAAARLHHTNIVPVFGVGEADGLHFYAMQFIRGEGLDRVLDDLRRLRRPPAAAAARGSPPTAGVPRDPTVAQSLLNGQFEAPPTDGDPLSGGASDTVPIPRAEPRSPSSLSAAGTDAVYYRGVARIALQVAEALAYAHRQGVLHRDVKPSNLLLDGQGTVWVTDFGLAKAEGSDELTQTGDIVGTLRFMAPERFDGRSLPQSDLYSLGLTLYELLTLRPAFDDTNKGRLIERVLREPPVPPRRLDPRVPRDLETVVLKCLAKDPAERYPAAEEMAEDLRRFLADRPILARRASQAEQAWRWCRRNPAVAGLAGAVGLLLVLAAAGGFLTALWLDKERQGAVASARQAEEARADATNKLWASYLAQARAGRWSGRPGRQFNTLDTLAQAVAIRPSLELRNEAVACLALADLKKGPAWDGYPEGSAGLAFDAGLERYARSDGRGNVSIRRVADDRELARLPGIGKPAWFLRFSPDGRYLAVRVDHVLSRVWEIGRARLVFEAPAAAMDFAPDGSFVALNNEAGVELYELPSAKKRGRPRQAPGGAYALAVAPDGRLAASCFDDGRPAVEVHDLVTDRVIATLPHAGGVRAVAWRPDGRLLAAAAGDWRIHVWDTASWQRVAVLEGHESVPIDVCFSHDGLHLASGAWDGTVRLWDPLAKALLLTCPGGFGAGWPQLRFSPDDRRLAFGWDMGTKVWLWEADPAHACRTFRAHRAPLKRTWSAALSGDARLLASTHDDGVRLWDLAADREVAHLPQGGCAQSAFFLDGDRGLVVYCAAGLYRWPITRDPRDPANRLRVGPPERLLHLAPTEPACFMAQMSLDRRRIAACDRAHGRTVVLDLAGRTTHPVPGYGYVAISPDGRWVARWQAVLGPSREVAVAEVATGKVVWEAQGRFMPGAFSPDGRWLATCGDTCRLWEVGSWRPGPEFTADADLGKPMFCAYSPDGRVLAIAYSSQVIRLVDPGSGREYATLASPSAQGITSPVFSADGSLLAVACSTSAVQVWDLRAARRRLAGLHLDWEAEPFPTPAADRPEALSGLPLQIEVDAGGLNVDPGKRLAALRLNNDAWQLVNGPAGKRDPERALRLARQAVALDSANPILLNTLGVVQYRNGRYAEAAATLEKSLAEGAGQFDGFDLFFLAMCRARLGDAARARDCFDRAARWAQARQDLPTDQAEELKAFRAEAERVLNESERSPGRAR